MVAIIIAKYCHNFHYTKNEFYTKQISSSAQRTKRMTAVAEGEEESDEEEGGGEKEGGDEAVNVVDSTDVDVFCTPDENAAL